MISLEFKVRLGSIFKFHGSLWLYMILMLDIDGFIWVKLGLGYILLVCGVLRWKMSCIKLIGDYRKN